MAVSNLDSELRKRELDKLEAGLAEMLRIIPAKEIAENIGGPTALNLLFFGYLKGKYRANDLRMAAAGHAKKLLTLAELAEAYRRLVEYSEQKALSGTTGNNE